MQLDVQVNIQYTLYIVRYVNNNNNNNNDDNNNNNNMQFCIPPLLSVSLGAVNDVDLGKKEKLDFLLSECFLLRRLSMISDRIVCENV